MGDGPPGGGVMRYHKRTAFRPVGPRGKALAAILEGRVGEYRVLTLDASPGAYGPILERPTNAPLHGMYTRYDEIGLYYRFYIKGIPFERRVRGVACGNAGALWVTLGGTSYQIADWGARWP